MTGPNRLLKFQGPEFWQTIAGPDENPYPLAENNPTVYYARKLSSVGYPNVVGNTNLEIGVAEDRDGEEIRSYVYNMCGRNYIEQGQVMMVWISREGQRFTIDPANATTEFVIVCHKKQNTSKGYGNVTCLNKENGNVLWTYHLDITSQRFGGFPIEAIASSAYISPEGDVYVSYDFYTPNILSGQLAGGVIKLDLNGVLKWNYQITDGNQATVTSQRLYNCRRLASLDGSRIFYSGRNNNSDKCFFILDRDGNEVQSFNRVSLGYGFGRIKIRPGGDLIVETVETATNTNFQIWYADDYLNNRKQLAFPGYGITKGLTMIKPFDQLAPNDAWNGERIWCVYANFDKFTSFGLTRPYYVCHMGTFDEAHPNQALNVAALESMQHVCQQYPQEYDLQDSEIPNIHYSKSWGRATLSHPHICGTTNTEFIADQSGLMIVNEYIWDSAFGGGVHTPHITRELGRYVVLGLERFGFGGKFGIPARDGSDNLFFRSMDADSDDNLFLGLIKNSAYCVRRYEGSEKKWNTDFIDEIYSVKVSGGE